MLSLWPLRDIRGWRVKAAKDTWAGGIGVVLVAHSAGLVRERTAGLESAEGAAVLLQSMDMEGLHCECSRYLRRRVPLGAELCLLGHWGG